MHGAHAVAQGVDPTLHAAARQLAEVDDADVVDEDDGIEWIDVESGAA